MADKWTYERINTHLIPLITQQYPVSLRMLDWLCVNYSKQHGLAFLSPQDGNSYQFCELSSLYKQQLKEMKRTYFDPCRRHERIYFMHDNEVFETTIAQLQFLDWAINNNILEFARLAAGPVSKEMQNRLRTLREQKKEPNRRKTEAVYCSKKALRNII